MLSWWFTGPDTNKWSLSLVNEHGSCSPNGKFTSSPYVSDYEISPQKWENSCKIMDEFLEDFSKYTRDVLPPFLKIKEIIRSGSARDGLKSLAPDEFDVIISFQLIGAQFMQSDYIQGKDGRVVTGITKLRVYNGGQAIAAYTDASGYINTVKLKDKLKGCFDRALVQMNQKYPERTVKRKEHKTGIQLELVKGGWRKDTTCCIDIIPGFELDLPGKGGYAVMKHMGKKNKNIPEHEHSFCWRVSTCNYEKHYIDDSMKFQGGKILWTANRILKAYFENLKQLEPLNQLPSIVKSYHLKNICMEIFQKRKDDITSTKEALRLILDRLELCLARGKILYFFHGNNSLREQYRYCPFLNDEESNLLENVSYETLNQTRRAFPRTRATLENLFDESSCAIM